MYHKEQYRSYNETELDALISQIYFWNKTLHVSDSSSVHHQQFFTVHTAMVYVIQLASRIRTERPDALISQIYFWNKTLHVSDSSSAHHQQFFTVHTAMVYVIQVCCSQAVWHIPLLCEQWNTADDGQRNCPKHVEFYSKNKFEKLVHLVGFIIRICHDARSHKRQKPYRIVMYYINHVYLELITEGVPSDWTG